jgi:hypothetical protein
LTWKLVDVSKNCDVPIPNPLLLISQINLSDCNNGLFPFPINIWFCDKFVVPIPPKETGKVPDVTLDAFNAFFKA